MSANIVLSVDDLSIGTVQHGPAAPLVHGVTWELQSGETLGLVGESGSGKSLTLRAVAGLPPPGVVTLGGTIAVDVDGQGLRQPERSPLGRGMAMVFQEPMTSLNPTMRVGDLITVGPRSTGRLQRRDSRARALSLLTEVGIPDPERRLDAWPHELSGGLRQRVMIAMALATDPRILLCDEPTTALDVSVQDQILRLLASLKESHHLSVVLVTHDLAVVGQVCDRVVVMQAGRVVESGPTDEILQSPTQPYTRQLLEAAS
jgi:ABC-type dipeptide/oligopeptide/nickel transport system ATPase component